MACLHRLFGAVLWIVLCSAGATLQAQTRGVSIDAARANADSLELGRYHALIIGNNEHEHLPNLQTAISDASAVAEVLRLKYGFREVRLRLNATRADILLSLNRYRRELEPDDRLLIYYAGHGHLDRESEEGYWLPVDAETENPLNWVSNSHLTNTLKAIRARHVLVVADSCYSGALTRGKEPASQGDNRDRLAWLTRISGKRARTALVSGGLEPVVDGGRNGHSVFASAFLDVLRDNDRLLDGQGLFDLLKGRVVVNAAQTPKYGNIRFAHHEGGDFIFAPVDAVAKRRPVAAPPVPGAGAAEATARCMLVWQEIAGSPVRADFEAYLAAYPDCPMAPIARARLAALAPDGDAGRTVGGTTMRTLKNTNVRAGPGVATARLDTLLAGSAVDVTGRAGEGRWLRVRLADGRRGYILASLLGDIETEAPVSSVPRSKLAVGLAAPRYPVGSSFNDCEGCPEMVVIPAGRFSMGSPADEAERDADEGPVHGVRIAEPLAVGKYEVSFEEWDRCVDAGGCDGYRPDDAGDGRGRRPVTHVSWEDARAYVDWLSRHSGQPYRLLSEAEWEYAARAGTTTAYHTGVKITAAQASFGGTVQAPRPVGSYPANAFGVHDAHGNVWEWVQDCYRGDYVAAPADGRAKEAEDCTVRVLRGGSWNEPQWGVRAATRAGFTSAIRVRSFGFRVARSLPRQATAAQ